MLSKIALQLVLGIFLLCLTNCMQKKPKLQFIMRFSLDPSGSNTDSAEIEVKQASNLLANGSNYHFGTLDLGSTSSTVTFTIENIGAATLALSSLPYLSGNGSGDFTLDTTATAMLLEPNDVTSFTVRCHPSSATNPNASIVIASNDQDESNYSIHLSANVRAAEIDVVQSASIVNGGSYHFSDVSIGQNSSQITFEITNTGMSNLTLSSLPSLSGADASEFVIDTGSTSDTIASGASTSFTLQFIPSSIGSKSATITILSNDSDENTYTIHLNGEAIDPVINILYSSTSLSLANNGVLINPSEIGLSSSSLDFTITSSGIGTLQLEGPVLSGTNASAFTVDASSFSTSIVSGNSTHFSIVFSPTTMGLHTAVFTVASNDVDKASYSITIYAYGLQSSCSITRESGIQDKILFVTPTGSTGNLGGISGADSTCNSSSPASIFLNTNFKAMLGAATRSTTLDWVFTANTRYFNTSGECIFKTDSNGLPQFNFENPIITGPTTFIRTGLQTDFTVGNSCNNWTSDSGPGIAGRADDLVDVSVLNVGSTCGSSLTKFVCVQQ